MTVSVNCATKVITLDNSDATLFTETGVGTDIFVLDIEVLRQQLKDWEDGLVGMAMPDTHSRNAPVTLSGVTYAQTLEIINGYTITFTPNTAWRVRCEGANHNIADVMNVNSVSIEIANSAGLQVVETGISGLTEAESAALVLIRKLLQNKQITDPNTGLMTVYDDDDSTPLLTGYVYEDAAGGQAYRGQGIDRREKLAPGA